MREGREIPVSARERELLRYVQTEHCKIVGSGDRIVWGICQG